MAWFRRHAALIASIILCLTGLLSTFTASPAVGLVIFFVGLAFGIYAAWRLWQTRPDPYDLSKLFDKEEEFPTPRYEDDGVVDQNEDLLVCLNCGSCSPPNLRRCPECGASLG